MSDMLICSTGKIAGMPNKLFCEFEMITRSTQYNTFFAHDRMSVRQDM